MRLCIPITRPSKSKRGPPESPPRSRLSVRMVSSFLAMTLPMRMTMPRSLSKPPGCPRPKHQSPIEALPRGAISTKGQEPDFVILSIPPSEISEPPRLTAGSLFPLGSRTLMVLPLDPMTWAAVRTRPSSETIIPLPAPPLDSMETRALRPFGSRDCMRSWISSKSSGPRGTVRFQAETSSLA